MVSAFSTPEVANNEEHKTVSVRCKHCKSQNYSKEGYRKTQQRGRIAKYLCRDCDRYFTADNGFYRMRNPEDKITEAIDLYFSNLSSRKVRNHFRRHRPKNCSHITVLDWCRRYTLKVNKYVETLNPQITGNFYADETEVDCQKRKDRFWVCVDYGTRYITGTHYSLSGDISNAIEFIQKATSKGLPRYIQTDAAQFYPQAMRRLFYDVNIQAHNNQRMKVEHRINNVSKTKKHNVRIETVFMKVKDRVDDFRGFKALWSAPILLQGIILQHNLIEAHTTTGRIPAELAQIKLEVGANRWLGLIKEASIKD